jgi:U-box domain
MDFPVLSPYGHAFERAAIQQWLARSAANARCPLTRREMLFVDLEPHYQLMKQIHTWRLENQVPVAKSREALSFDEPVAKKMPGSVVQGEMLRLSFYEFGASRFYRISDLFHLYDDLASRADE